MPAATAIVTPAEVRTHLNLAGSSGAEDPELAGFAQAATEVIQDMWGYVVGTAFTEEHDGGGLHIKTLRRPVYSVTSLTESWGASIRTLTVQPLATGTSFDAYGYTLDTETGLFTRRAGAVASTFAPGRRNVLISYLAGMAAAPGKVRLACLDLIEHMWERSQRGGRLSISTAEDYVPVAGYSFMIPRAVLELLGLDDTGPGIA